MKTPSVKKISLPELRTISDYRAALVDANAKRKQAWDAIKPLKEEAAAARAELRSDRRIFETKLETLKREMVTLRHHKIDRNKIRKLEDDLDSALRRLEAQGDLRRDFAVKDDAILALEKRVDDLVFENETLKQNLSERPAAVVYPDDHFAVRRAIPPDVRRLPMPEKYTLELTLTKILEKPDGSRDRQCHRAVIETNGLDQGDFSDMQKDVAVVVEKWAVADEPQNPTPSISPTPSGSPVSP